VGSEDGSLAFSRSILDFQGFDVRGRHHESVARNAERIADEFDRADEWISDAAARRMAYNERVSEPSAYDIIFLCNFLTQPGILEEFEVEINRLALSLTPGGLLVILGAVGAQYPKLYEKIREIIASVGLHDASPAEPLQANENHDSLQLVATHVRENVRWALANCSSEFRKAAESDLTKDLVDETVQFELPRFRSLVFVRQGRIEAGTRVRVSDRSG
jgi:hypothetical protein